MESESNDLAPGLILGDVGIQVPDDTEVRTDVCCFVRVRRLPEPPEASDGAEVETLRLKPLPGSPDGADCLFILRHAQLDRWQEDAFTGEFRTRQPACARSYFANGGVTLHLLDLDFFVPSFDPMALGDGVDVMQVAEDREVVVGRDSEFNILAVVLRRGCGSEFAARVAVIKEESCAAPAWSRKHDC